MVKTLLQSWKKRLLEEKDTSRTTTLKDYHVINVRRP